MTVCPSRLAEMARLSEAAYKPEGEAGRLAREVGWTIVNWFDRGDTQGFLAVRGAEAVLVFRGTELSWRDILSDLRFNKTEPVREGGWPRGRVHAGFKAALDEVWQDVTVALRALAFRRDFTLWLTGHSLGGALATLAAARIRGQGLAFVGGVASFGAPRVGCPEFARSLEVELGGRLHRVVNNCDLVARLLFITFAHAAAMLYLTRRGRMVSGPALALVLWDMLLGALIYRVCRPWRWKPDALNDHRSSEYSRLCRALAQGGRP